MGLSSTTPSECTSGIWSDRNLIAAYSEEKLYAIINNNSIGIDVLDFSGKLVYVNNFLADMLGYTCKELLAMTVPEFTHQDDIKPSKDAYNALTEGLVNYYRIEKRYLKKDGIPIWCDLSVTPFTNENGQRIGSICIIQDISKRRKFESALEKSEKKYKYLFDNLRDVFCRFAADGTILMISPSVHRVTGFSSDEVIGTKVYDYLMDSNRIAPFIETVKQNGFIEQYDFPIKTKNGNYIWTSITAKLLFDSNGNSIGIEGIIRDITQSIVEEEKLKDTLENYKFLTDTMGEGLVKLDQDLVIEYANPAFCAMISSDINHIRNKSILDFLTESSVDLFKNSIIEYIGNQTSAFESIFIDTLGHKTQTKLTPNIRYDISGNILGIVAVVTEITKLKEIEYALKESEKQLQDSLASKNKFMSIIAHDLKGPLSNFVALSKMLQNEYADMEEDDIQELSTSIHSSAIGIHKLLEDLLNWSKSQMGSLKITPEIIDMREISFNICYLLHANAHNKNITISSHINNEIYAWADRNMITTVLRNIVSNSLKFTENGGDIIIAAQQKLGHIEVTIKDNGVGMSQDTISKLFRIDTHPTTIGTSYEKGSGLGLILCKEFIEKNNGSISVSSEVGKGSIFSFTLPLPVNNQLEKR